MILGSITDLSDDLRLDGLDTAAPVVVNARRFICGGINVQVAANDGGRILSLIGVKEGNNIYGSYTQDQVDSLNIIWAAGVTVSLVHHRGTFTVLIQNIEVVPVVGVSDPDAAALYVGTVTMIEM